MVLVCPDPSVCVLLRTGQEVNLMSSYLLTLVMLATLMERYVEFVHSIFDICLTSLTRAKPKEKMTFPA